MKYIIDVPDEHTDIKVFYTDADMKIIQSMRCEPYTEPDGCKDCKFELTEEWEEPCRRCCNSYKNMWRAKE